MSGSSVSGGEEIKRMEVSPKVERYLSAPQGMLARVKISSASDLKSE